MLQADLSRQSLQIPLGQQQIGQPEQAKQLRGVLGQAAVTHLAMSEAYLDHLKRGLDLGTQLRLGVFDLALSLIQHTVFAVLLVTAGPRGNRPNHVPASMLRNRSTNHTFKLSEGPQMLCSLARRCSLPKDLAGAKAIIPEPCAG